MNTRSPHHTAPALLTTAMILLGCSTPEADDGAGGSASSTPTFHADVEPILQRSCLSCHREGQIGGFSLETYDDVAPMAGMIAAVTAAGLMPPFKARDTDDCKVQHAFRNDPRLSDAEIETLRAWADNDAPKGDPALAPPPYVAPLPGLKDADLTMTPSTPYTVEGDEDDFVCVVFDPAFESPTWVGGLHLLADNTQVAHHAVTSLMTRDEALAISGGAERFPCFGGAPGVMIHGWAPGGPPFDLPEGVGMQIGSDEVLVVQMHYHPEPGEAHTDASSIQLRLSDTAPTSRFVTVLLGNARSAAEGLLAGPGDAGTPRFLIPANAEDHAEEMRFEVADVPGELPILLVGNHMHYLGKDMRTWIERPDRRDQLASECLVQTPDWDFNWQTFYSYDAPIAELPTVANGDVVHIRCEYDNSMGNRFLGPLLEEQGLSAPVDVSLGEGSLEEMCVGLFGVLVPVN